MTILALKADPSPKESNFMFHDIDKNILARMAYLEKLDSDDRADGTPRLKRLRQIPPETGRFLALMALNAPEGDIVEIGTSAGYSTLWLTLAAGKTGRRVITFEILEDKIKLAQETFRLAGVEDIVELVGGDAGKFIPDYKNIPFCFLDAEKEDYGKFYDMIIPRMVSGGLLIADNAINHRETLKPMINRALTDNRVDAVVVPIGKGELVCRKI
jgi:caffeoyl-CoA O-methyltransferase